jgi:predicted dienelactone hydrolase
MKTLNVTRGMQLTLLAAMVLLILGPVSAQQRHDAPPYAIRGPYSVGTMGFGIEDDSRPLSGHIWYPALNPDDLEEAITYTLGLGDMVPPVMNELPGKALLNADPDQTGAPYPLVVSSHGLGGSYTLWAYLHEQLASHGFVVMAFGHTGNTLVDSMSATDEETQTVYWEAAIDSLVLRPMDITRVIDYAEMQTADGGILANLIDTDRIGVIGVSYGGYSSLAAAGAQLDLASITPFCDQGIYTSMLATQLCNRYPDGVQERLAQLGEIAGVDFVSDELFPSLGDPRVDVIVPVVPMAVVFGEDGPTNVDIPALFLAAGGDVTAVSEYNVYLAYEHVSGANKTLVTFENAGHGFSLECPESWVTVSPFCSDPVWDTDRTQDLTSHFTVAFLRSELYDDEEAAAALVPDAVMFPGIAYQTTGY